MGGTSLWRGGWGPLLWRKPWLTPKRRRSLALKMASPLAPVEDEPYLVSLLLHPSGSEVAQSCLTLCDPMDCSPPGSTIHGIFQARGLQWVAISFSNLHLSGLLNVSGPNRTIEEASGQDAFYILYSRGTLWASRFTSKGVGNEASHTAPLRCGSSTPRQGYKHVLQCRISLECSTAVIWLTHSDHQEDKRTRA